MQKQAVAPKAVEVSLKPSNSAVEAVGAGGCERFRPLVQKYDWDVKIAMAVMKAESGCREMAVGYNTNGTNDKGLMQVNSIHDKTDRRFDPEYNIALSYKIYKERMQWDDSGWMAWSSCLNGAVRCF